MSNKSFSNAFAASAVMFLALATLIASPTTGNCRMQYQHIDEIVAPPVVPTTPLVAAGATLSAALLAVGLGKHLAAKKGL